MAEGSAGSQRRGKPRRRPAAAPKTRRSAPGAKPRPGLGRPATARPSNGWLELVMTIVQAPVGMGRSQAERLVGELVKTGNLGQREAERLLNEVRGASERAQGRAASAADGLDRFIENRIEVVLNRVNIPSRSDIERLNKSVDVLTAKVDALLGRNEKGAH